MNNQEFISAIEESFKRFLDSGTSRSTAKLKPLHGAIANDLSQRLGRKYTIQAQGYGNDKEGTINGRYINKNVDIVIRKGNVGVCGIAVKFVMQNYAQNSNNYFESMLGETANIRSANCPYFQIFIILDQLPYYSNGGDFKHWENFSSNNAQKYFILAQDNAEKFYHTPNKTLICVVSPPKLKHVIVNKKEYISEYLQIVGEASRKGTHFMKFVDENIRFDHSVILNDYETFAEKVYHTIMAQ